MCPCGPTETTSGFEPLNEGSIPSGGTKNKIGVSAGHTRASKTLGRGFNSYHACQKREIMESLIVIGWLLMVPMVFSLFNDLCEHLAHFNRGWFYTKN